MSMIKDLERIIDEVADKHLGTQELRGYETLFFIAKTKYESITKATINVLENAMKKIRFEKTCGFE